MTHDDEGNKEMKAAEGVEDNKEYPCLLRVSVGTKDKFSTRVRRAPLLCRNLF